jgi:hypothetical protein
LRASVYSTSFSFDSDYVAEVGPTSVANGLGELLSKTDASLLDLRRCVHRRELTVFRTEVGRCTRRALGDQIPEEAKGQYRTLRGSTMQRPWRA